MDPLSITASAIALIGAAGKISTSLWGFVQSLRGADTRVSCLCDELTSLVRLLQAVERTLKECRAFDLALLEEDLCHQSELALADCQVTLNELSLLVDKIKSTARTKSFARRARVVADFAVHGTELEVFREKIHKCNWALQTMLHTITVSLSLKNHASQDLILVQLDKLKSSFTLALQASHGSRSGFSPSAGDRSDTRIARNLMNLAKAARSFHSTASSTASSLATNSIRPSHFGSDVAMSYNGDLSPSQYERLMDYLNDDSTPMPSQLNFDTTLLSGRSSVHGDPRPSERTDIDEADEDVEQEFERLFLTGLEEAARDRIKHQDYSKAIEFLKSALRQPRRSMPNVTKQHEMQKLIALSHFLQGNWKLAEPIVWKLSNSKSTMDHAVCTLLHALSIAYLSRYELDKALETCKQAVFGKHRLIKTQDIDDRDYDDTLGLLITIYGMTGDYIRAEIFRRRLPEGFRYRHCANETEYIATHPNFLGRLLGGDAPSIETNWQQSPTCHELEADFNDQAKAAFSPQSVWAANISHHEKCEVDTEPRARGPVLPRQHIPFRAGSLSVMPTA
ncbi:hypothetical protein F4780DRAFT_704262 [Xylariomycetidae sp. FL0641]|nr:hypothetical protein F4780DRAFT_704262 [Xylariomycetidae sp. FL0641]